MHQTFEITRSSRKILSTFLENHSLEQLNKIPDGFNNNLIWNIGHIIVVQQMLVYGLSNLPLILPDEMVQKYKKGTKPETFVLQEDVDLIQSFLFETINKTKDDFKKGIFKSYSEYTTMSGVVIKNVEDAMSFNCYHEAIHTGVLMCIRKFVL